jgi:hypothetical protein
MTGDIEDEGHKRKRDVGIMTDEFDIEVCVTVSKRRKV